MYIENHRMGKFNTESSPADSSERDPEGYNLTHYRKLLSDFDATVCEAIAVSQAVPDRLETRTRGFSTHVFTRICGHATSFMFAAPLSRWSRKEFEHWDVSSVAPHARAILEGYLLFSYLSNAPDDDDAQKVYADVMLMHDCQKRISILPFMLDEEAIGSLKAVAEDLQKRLLASPYFSTLPAATQKDLLKGKRLTIPTRETLLAEMEFEKSEFDFYWNYLSQYTHVLSFTFFRLERNGKGTGLENSFDREAICFVLEFATSVLRFAVDRFVELFPETASQRNGLDSKFYPGPQRNVPKHIKRAKRRLR